MNKLIKIFFVMLLIKKLIWPQMSSNQPSIGYVYPSGGQRGTIVEFIVGGQNIRGARDVYFSNKKIKVISVTPIPPLNPQQKRLLTKNIREIVGSWYRKDFKKPEITYEMEGVKLPNHPLLKDLENKTFDEIKNIIEIFLTPYRTEQIKRSIQEKVLVKAEIASDIEPGVYELKIQTFSGLTNSLNFYVSDVKEVKEKEKIPFFTVFDPPKEVFDTPIIINGQIFPGDIDKFYFNAKKGQKLIIELKGRDIIPFMADAVPGWFQGVLTLYDSKGKEIAFVDDYYFNPDPVIFFEVPYDDEYIIEVRDAIYRGREDFVYRLFIGEKPFITYIFPPGAEKYEEAVVSIYGWNLDTKMIKLNTDLEEDKIYKLNVKPKGLVSNDVCYIINDIQQIDEKEPNDIFKNANFILIPQIVNGKISKKGDVDNFKFKCSKGDKIAIEVYSRRLGYPLDSLILLTDSNGKILAKNDDYFDKSFDILTHHADSYILFEVPKDDVYYLKIIDAQSHGGEEYIYRIRIEKAKPNFDLFVSPSSINIPLGATVPFYIYAVRKDGFDGEIEIYIKDPPEGLTLNGNKIPKGKDKICLTITANSSFISFNNPIPIKIEGIANINGHNIKKVATPCDEMMQAFAYFHLVPVSELLVFVNRRRFSTVPIFLNEINILKIPIGGKVKIEGKTSINPESEKIILEVKEPTEGISIEDIKIENGIISFFVKVDNKVKKGFTGNLIIEVFTEYISEKEKKSQRVSKGFLPAIMFEII
ncbi:MAG: PPC domain-containing protein [bacterium]|nr:PPC domain-containing protein [bacterium]